MLATTAQAAAPTGSPTANAGATTGGPVEGPIAADPALETENDGQEDAQSIVSTSTASLSESIYEYRRLHGRTYTQKTDYYGPNDERHGEVLEINHYWMTLFLGDKLFLAPIGDSPQRVLDLGTGTGIWAIDFADEFPSAEAIGVDISPTQPAWVPPNCKFQVDDIEKFPWTWQARYFDFIHIRNLEGCVADWPGLYEQAFEALRPGTGYIEIKEFDIDLKSQAVPDLDDDHVFKRWGRLFFEAFDKMGKTAKQHRDHGIARNLEAAGFVDVVEKKWPVPIGPWAKDPVLKEVGTCLLQFLDEGLEGFGTFLAEEIMGWEHAEIVVFMAEMRKAIKDKSLQPRIDLHLVYARRPEEPKEE